MSSPSSVRSARVLLVSVLALSAGLFAAVMPNSGPSQPRGASSGPSPSDRQAIEKLAQDYAFAWSTHDVPSLATLYTPDASVMTVSQGGARGRDAVQTYLQTRVGEENSNARAALTVQTIEPIAPGMALADVREAITEVDPATGVGNTELGTYQISWVLKQQGGRWQIRAERIADAVPPRAVPKKGVGGAGVAGLANTGVVKGRVNPLPSRNQLRQPTANWPSDQLPANQAGAQADPTRTPFQTPGGF